MNRNWVQIFVGATALTGAFFFGSVMQRRHGDLDKKTAPQPMLENEDLVWQDTPALTAEGSNSRPQPMVTEQTPGTDSALSAAEKPNESIARSSEVAPQPSKLESEEQLARKVVQPDFSRWANSSQTAAASGGGTEAAPMLPLGKTPPLLDEPAQPSGPLSPPPRRQVEQPIALETDSTPEHDPWTAPLSSVLLKPPASNPEKRELAPVPSGTNADSQPTAAPAPMLPAGQGSAAIAPGPSAAAPATGAASNTLVPFSQPGMKKLEVDTDSFRIHVVRAGDTLQSLAQKYYGKADFYLDIYLANQDQLTSPINLPAGKALKIPDYSK